MALRLAIFRYGALGLLAVVLCACAETNSYDPKDPWSDPFFHEGFRSNELDHIWQERAPSVGWLNNPDHINAHPPKDVLADDDPTPSPSHENELLGAEPAGGAADEADSGDEEGGQPRASFSERAQEATLATLSVLVGAGMAALPYLIGT